MISINARIYLVVMKFLSLITRSQFQVSSIDAAYQLDPMLNLTEFQTLFRQGLEGLSVQLGTIRSSARKSTRNVDGSR